MNIKYGNEDRLTRAQECKYENKNENTAVFETRHTEIVGLSFSSFSLRKASKETP
jgi:hypothetical protein